ncbi:hypothetical protein V5799_026853 [Amblyomma americanum]|uniref:Uncharacterized protein n=1 Tax=Amblyomma americanum TaxID=6943 RepID=A0AAQ4DHE0_AMBAM
MESIELDPMAQPLFPGAQLNHHESLLLVMAHSLRHHNSKKATESLLALLHSHLPKGSELPATKYMFEKYFRDQEQAITSHFYCSTCRKYIGVADEGDDVFCSCGLKHSAKVLQKEGSYFVWIGGLSSLIS